MASLRGRLLASVGASADDGCLIIGEVAQAHDGSLGTAHAFIDAIADTGADAVKFQTHIADAESTPDEPWRVRFSPQDEHRIDYWRRMEFTPEQWQGLERHAGERGLVFLSSPFSPEAVDLLESIGVPAWKVASGEIHNPPLLRQMAATAKPMLLSTGMSTLEEVDHAIRIVMDAWKDTGHDPGLAVLQCTTAYPCPPERIGIEQLEVFRRRWRCAVGLSDHSGTPFPSLAAATLGADVVEVHVAFDRRTFGPDVAASVTVDELAELVRGIRFIERMKASPVDKTVLPESALSLRKTFGKRVVAARPLPAGTVLVAADLALKKPGDGLPPHRLEGLVGRRLMAALDPDQPLADIHLAPVSDPKSTASDIHLAPDSVPEPDLYLDIHQKLDHSKNDDCDIIRDPDIHLAPDSNTHLAPDSNTHLAPDSDSDPAPDSDPADSNIHLAPDSADSDREDEP